MAERVEFHLPDIGDFHDVDVVEVLVAPGQRVEKEQSLIVLESDKATTEVPSPVAGVIEELRVRVGDQVNEGDLIAVLRAEAPAESAPARAPAKAAPKPTPAAAKPAPKSAAPPAAQPTERELEPEDAPAAPRAAAAHAGPSVRRLARELGVDLSLVPGTARKGRITREDVQAFVKASLSRGSAGGVPIAGVAVAAPLDIDFSKWGPTELQPLNRVRRTSAANLHRSWVTIPHVTQFDEADITELAVFRAAQKEEAARREVKLTFLPFVVKAVTAALREFPHFNASLDRTGESLIVKRYLHIGVAVDTENGLLVPVIRDADRKSISQLAAELDEVATEVREGKFDLELLQGGTFTISNLGSVGGTYSTPIINPPQVAILLIGRSRIMPQLVDKTFEPRLVMPLSITYDHRLVDGAAAARFLNEVKSYLAAPGRLLLAP